MAEAELMPHNLPKDSKDNFHFVNKALFILGDTFKIEFLSFFVTFFFVCRIEVMPYVLLNFSKHENKRHTFYFRGDYHLRDNLSGEPEFQSHRDYYSEFWAECQYDPKYPLCERRR